MDARLSLVEDDKKQLVDEILRLRGENKKLRLENEALRKKSEEKTRKGADKKLNFVKDHGRPGLPPHLWGRKGGHTGVTRAKPTHADREVAQTLSACPDCHHALGAAVGITAHVQEDIVPARVEVTRFLHHRYWCPGCKALVTAPHAPDEAPHGYIGPRALATMAWLKHHLALPGEKIQALPQDFCVTEITVGAIHKAHQRLAHYLRLEEAQVLTAVRDAPIKHADETGWTVNGRGHWLWNFVTPRFVYTHIGRRVRRIKDRLFAFATEAHSHRFRQRISAQLLKYHQEIFTFLDVPGLPSDNNAAERSIKPHVIIRHRSFQNRTDRGANAHGVLASILQSLILQNRPVIQDLAAAYPLHRQNIARPLLFTLTR